MSSWQNNGSGCVVVKIFCYAIVFLAYYYFAYDDDIFWLYLILFLVVVMVFGAIVMHFMRD